MTSETEKDLATLIDAQASPTGLTKADGGHPIRQDLPPGGEAWLSEHAWMLLWPVDDASSFTIKQAWRDAERHLDEVIPDEVATGGSVIDGYVVLALPERPTGDDALAMIREAELSPHICRKHVVWRDDEANDEDDGGASGRAWRNVDTITVLSLPNVTPSAGRVAFPQLPADAAALLDRILIDWRKAAEDDQSAVNQEERS
jgi:hypothetical protein